MSKFVNFKKRDVALPPGCKNLIDVLQPRPVRVRDMIGTAHRPMVAHGGSVTGGLADFEKYVGLVFASQALDFELVISPPGKRLTVHVNRTKGEAVCASVLVQAGTDIENALLQFLKNHDCTTLEDSGIPDFFNPSLPVHVHHDVLPVPTDAAQLARLLVGLFHDVCGVNDASEVNFNHWECSHAG